MHFKKWGFLYASLFVLGGLFISANAVSSSGVSISSVAPITGNPALVPADQNILDDLIVQFSACVGNDCVNGESFGFDTLRLKENNTRIKFLDTSNTSAFPTNDWTLVANDSSNGGDNYFAIEDTTAGYIPFKVEAQAGRDALIVADGGNVGIGTADPDVGLHLVQGNTPSVRIEQDGSEGWTPYIWDIAGNEAGFFVRDVTENNSVFRIFPQSGKNNLVIRDNRIGVGTAAPQQSLHVYESGGAVPTVRLSQGTDMNWDLAGDTSAFSLKDSKNGTIPFQIEADAGTNALYIDSNGNVGIGNNTPSDSLHVTGNIYVTGGLTQASDRNLKENIEPVSNQEILDQLVEMPVYTWNYIADADEVTHLGPMSQDFHAATALGSDETISALDMDGALIASVQALHETLSEKEADIDALERENEALEARLDALEGLVAEMLAAQTDESE